MDWQLALVVLAVAGALAYVGRQVWRTWSGSKCGGGCCSKAQRPSSATEAPLITVEQLTARARQRPPR